MDVCRTPKKGGNIWLNLEQKRDMKKEWYQDFDPNFLALNQQTSVTDAEVFG